MEAIPLCRGTEFKGCAAVEQVAAGQAHTLFLVDPASLDLDKLDSWECETAVEEAAAPSGDAAKGWACAPCQRVRSGMAMAPSS